MPTEAIRSAAVRPEGGPTAIRPPQRLSLDELPGPRGLPLLGHALQLRPKQLHRVLSRWAEEFGSVYVFRVANKPILTIADADLINEVLRDRPEGYRRWRKMEELGLEIGANGVFIAEGENWRHHRKLVMSALSANHLKQFSERVEIVTGRLQRRWERAALNGGPVDIQRDLTRYTVDVTSSLAFGSDLNTLEQRGDAIQQHLEKIFPAIARRQTALFPYWRYLRLPADRELEVALAEVRKLINQLIAKSRAKLSADPVLRAKPTNLIEALIVAQENETVALGDDEIFGNILTVLLAGEDTTANTMAWMIHFMIEHPEIQAPMQEDADRVHGIGDHLQENISADRLRYIEAVAHETLRHRWVAPMLLLEPNADTQLRDIRVPKGTAVFVLTGHVGMQESNFVAAREFRPERWLHASAADGASHNTRAFMPFGAGPRFCPGRHLAMLEIRMVLGMLSRNFEVYRAPGTSPPGELYAFTMMPTELFVRFRPRREGGSGSAPAFSSGSEKSHASDANL